VPNTHDINDSRAGSRLAIERTRVESSAIASLGYEAQRGILEIEFSSGMVYQYFDVPPDVYRQALAATSKGQWFNEAIRDRFAYAPAQPAQPRLTSV
jgi:hypothetical protein